MYRPPAFARDDPDELYAALAHAGLFTVVTNGPDGFAASHVPLLLDRDAGERGALLGHVARANPQWRTPGPALVIVHGPDAYMSPSLYATKATNPRVVPTWNYVAVHVRGELVVHDDPAWVTDLVTRLTDQHERERDEQWSVADAPADYIAAMAKAIVGIEIRIDRMEGAWKLSQNRPAEDRASIVERFGAGTPDQRAVAELMRAQPG
jgi:transcriptional regulator